jgi:hypothetical protein
MLGFSATTKRLGFPRKINSGPVETACNERRHSERTLETSAVASSLQLPAWDIGQDVVLSMNMAGIRHEDYTPGETYPAPASAAWRPDLAHWVALRILAP